MWRVATRNKAVLRLPCETLEDADDTGKREIEFFFVKDIRSFLKTGWSFATEALCHQMLPFYFYKDHGGSPLKH